MLHSHLPWLLGHGRWPHGTDWLCEAVLNSYLPLLRVLAVRAPAAPRRLTIGITPVLAAQLGNPGFRPLMEEYLLERLSASERLTLNLRAGGEDSLLHAALWWRERIVTARDHFHALEGDLTGALAKLERDGAIELMSSAATHAYLPLLRRDESVRLQIRAGRAEHTRLFGTEPRGCWLPECGYRPAVRRELGGRPTVQPGIEDHLAAAGYRWFLVDAHVARAGLPLGAYGDVPLGLERFGAGRSGWSARPPWNMTRSPRQAYGVPCSRGFLDVLVRDPDVSLQVWSRQHGYPGDSWYLEFHKIRWPEGFRLWRVTGPVDLGAKQPYVPERAFSRAHAHAAHFASLLAARGSGDGDGAVIVAPFDTELFGHWWLEGSEFLAALFDELARYEGLAATTASDHLAAHPPVQSVHLRAGSWGADGDDRMWLNPGTEWTWQRLWDLEDAFWHAACRAIKSGTMLPVLAQAAREMMLAQASDWQFMITTGSVPDYGAARFLMHCENAEALVAAMDPARADAVPGALALADRLAGRHPLFPGVLGEIEAICRSSPDIE